LRGHWDLFLNKKAKRGEGEGKKRKKERGERG